MTSLNSFAYSTTQYPGFPSFKPNALKWVETFARKFAISELSRIGLRYTNHIPYVPGEVFPVNRYFRFAVTLGAHEPDVFADVSFAGVIPVEDGSLTLRIGSARTDSEETIIVFDFDFAFSGELEFSDIESYLDRSHAETKRFFEGLLTDEYREYLKGEVIE